MKKFVSTIMMVVSIMMTMLFMLTSFILGFRFLQALIGGTINTAFLLEFAVSIVMFGVFVAFVKFFGDIIDVDVHLTSDTIVGKHDDEDDRDE